MPSNKPRDDIPSAQEFAKLKTFLINRRPDGWERPDWVDKITEICGDDVNERSRAEIIDDLLAWMKNFPKR
jgi:hypothetical protein